MKRKIFDDYEDFCSEVDHSLCIVEEKAESNREYDGMVSIVAEYDDAKEILQTLIMFGYQIDAIDISSIDCSGYDDAFIISVYEDLIGCEQMKREDGYLYDYADITYLLDNCNSKIIPHLNAKHIYETHIKERVDIDDWLNSDDDDDDIYLDDFDPDNWECEYCDDFDCPDHPVNKKNLTNGESGNLMFERDQDDNVHGFTYTKDWGDNSYFSYSYHSSEEIDPNKVRKSIKEYDI